MSIFGIRDSGPNIVKRDLNFWVDAGQTVSYGKRANPTTGDVWYDRAGGRNATINNGFVNSYFLWNPANGGYFNEFASNDSYVTINNLSISSVDSITMQAVFMYEASQFEGPKFMAINGSGGITELGTGFGGNNVGIILYGGSRVTANVTQNAWNFVSATISIPSQTITLSINGGARSTGSHGSTTNINITSGWMVSRNATSGVALRGRLAAVMFYTRALSVDEELQNFNTYRIRYGI